MRRSVIASALLLLLVPGSRVRAQSDAHPWFRSHVVTAGLAGGGAAFTDFQRVEKLDAGTETSRRVSAQTTVAAAATLTYWFSRYWGVRAHGSYSPSRFVLRSAQSEPGAPADSALYARLGVYMADLDVVFRPPVVFGRVAPYGIVGAGIIEYRANPNRADPLPAEAAEAFDSGRQRRWAGVFGLGAVIPLDRRAFHLNFELTNHVARTPVRPPTAGRWTDPDVVLDPDGWGGDDDGSGLTSHIRLMVGITLPIRL